MSLTAIVWGAGFVVGNRLLANGFDKAPITLNTVRFAIGALVLLAIFAKRLRFSKCTLIYGCIGGALLCIAFNMQILGLNVSQSPTECGFVTAAYSIFTPFITWIFYKKRPGLLMFVGVAIAFAGLVVMNIDSLNLLENKYVFWGNMITLLGTVFFAVQIVLGDFALHEKKLDMITLTVTQIVSCAILMGLASVIFECKTYSTLEIDWSNSWWLLLIVSLGGTSFAYFSQTYAQQHISPTEIAILMAFESPVGAILSISLGLDKLTWSVIVGGILILVAIVIIEILPSIITKIKSKGHAEVDNDAEQHDDVDPPNEQ